MDIKKFVNGVFNATLTIAALAFIGLLLTAKANAPIVVVEALPQSPAVTAPSSDGAYVPPIFVECVVLKNVEEPKQTYSQEELDMLALAIYQEAGGDIYSDEVRMMVGNVVLNRVADPRFPDTMYEVLTEVTEAGYGAYGRLHWTGIVWPDRASYLSEAHAVQRAYDCAERLLNGERVFSDDVVFQAEFKQGTETVWQVEGFYFCR